MATVTAACAGPAGTEPRGGCAGAALVLFAVRDDDNRAVLLRCDPLPLPWSRVLVGVVPGDRLPTSSVWVGGCVGAGRLGWVAELEVEVEP